MRLSFWYAVFFRYSFWLSYENIHAGVHVLSLNDMNPYDDDSRQLGSEYACDVKGRQEEVAKDEGTSLR